MTPRSVNCKTLVNRPVTSPMTICNLLAAPSPKSNPHSRPLGARLSCSLTLTMCSSVPPHLVQAGDAPDEMASQEHMGSTSPHSFPLHHHLWVHAYTYYRPDVQWSTIQGRWWRKGRGRHEPWKSSISSTRPASTNKTSCGSFENCWRGFRIHFRHPDSVQSVQSKHALEQLLGVVEKEKGPTRALEIQHLFNEPGIDQQNFLWKFWELLRRIPHGVIPRRVLCVMFEVLLYLVCTPCLKSGPLLFLR